jgi:photosystem II stability/assembly factor-like uncharacterized protein
MRHFYLFIFLIIIDYSVAQNRNPSEKNDKVWFEMLEDPEANFFETQKVFETYWKDKKIEKGKGFKPFKRWEQSMKFWVDEEGNKPGSKNYQKDLSVYIEKLTSNQASVYTPTIAPPSFNSNSNAAGWQSLGPNNIPTPVNWVTSAGGIGRVNAVGFHPTNNLIFYAGAPAGGLWKTIDGGSSWTCLTEHLGTLGVSDVVVNKNNPSRIVMGTGDCDSYDALGLGFFYSNDGGITWNQSQTGPTATVSRIVENTSNPNTLFSAVRGLGVYRSYDGGINWSAVAGGNFRDIKYHPTDTNILYAATSNAFFKSTNGGLNWTLISSTSHSRITIGVSPNAPNTVYLFTSNGSGFGAIYKSTNSGSTFIQQTNSSTPNLMGWSVTGSDSGGQAWYDMCIAVSPTNANELMVGGVNLWKSIDGGVNWQIASHWYGAGGNPNVHADMHMLRYNPSGQLFLCNDGGIHKKSLTNDTWTDLSSGLGISQIYKIGQSAQNPSLFIAGFQDNGTAIYKNGTWQKAVGGDGMECIIDPLDSNKMYAALYYGDVRKTSNYGNSYFSVLAKNGINGVTESGAWVTPYALSNFNSNTMFIGYQNIWRSTNIQSATPSFMAISSGASNKPECLESSRANQSHLYASYSGSLYKSTTATNATAISWSLVKSFGYVIHAIETVPNDTNIVYVAAGQRVYKSTDGGTNWSEISGNLNLSSKKRTLLWVDQEGGKGLYTADEFGVYFLQDGLTNWVEYSENLPNYSNVREIEYYEAPNFEDSKLTICTYGRGIWQNAPFSVQDTLFLYSTQALLCDYNVYIGAYSTADSISWYDMDDNLVYVGDTLVLNENFTSDFYYANAEINGVNFSDTVFITFGQSFKVKIKTDNQADQISYSFLFQNGNSAYDYNNTLANNETYLFNFCVFPNNCLIFQMKDAGGNGIQAPGYYQLYQDSVLIKDYVGGSYNYSADSTDFCSFTNEIIFSEDEITSCDSLINLNINANYGGDSIAWFVNHVYFSSNDTLVYNGLAPDSIYAISYYYGSQMNQAGISITIHDLLSDSIQSNICIGDTFFVLDTFFVNTGNYSVHLPSQDSTVCDSVYYIDLLVYQNSNHQINESICDGESYSFGGQMLQTAGVYTDTLVNHVGCDSILTLQLSVLPNSNHQINESICDGESYSFGGQLLQTAGVYTDTLVNYVGCDSVLTLQLSVLPNSNHQINESICDGESYSFGGQVLQTAGIYTDTLVNYVGCDSVLTLQLSVLPNSNHQINESICDGESYSFGGQVLQTAGVYTDTLVNYVGCDSVLTLQLSVLPNSNHQINESICDGESYSFGGQVLQTAGVYTDTLVNYVGCDSVLTLQLSVLPNSNHQINESICDGESYSFGGQLLQTAGVYTDTLVNYVGCDSVLTLQLSVLPNSNHQINESICDGETYSFGGQVLQTAGVYTDTLVNYVGCDSVLTLQLSVLPNSNHQINESICDGESYSFGGQVLQTAGVYTDTLVNYVGCDSVLSLHLSIIPVSNSDQDIDLCPGEAFNLNGEDYYGDNTLYDTLVNYLGCDSLITYNITELSVDNGVTVNGTTISSNQNGASYQWINCDDMNYISGENQSEFTAVENGFYAVEVTYNGCVDTSACTEIKGIGIKDFTDIGYIGPNPFNDKLQIVLNQKSTLNIDIIDQIGRVVLNQKSVEQEAIDLNTGLLPTGIYTLRIFNSQTGKYSVYKMFKE